MRSHTRPLGLISETDGTGVTSYYLSDGLGSTTQLTDEDGVVSNTYSYDVFGALRSSSGTTANQFDFTGQQADHGAKRGLMYLRARHYDPALGRFLGKDPLPLGNRYAYVGDNPMNLVDPNGLSPDGSSGFGNCVGAEYAVTCPPSGSTSWCFGICPPRPLTSCHPVLLCDPLSILDFNYPVLRALDDFLHSSCFHGIASAAIVGGGLFLGGTILVAAGAAGSAVGGVIILANSGAMLVVNPASPPPGVANVVSGLQNLEDCG